MTVRCHRCGREHTAERVGVRDVCTACDAYLHSCRNCNFYAPGVSHDCREPNAERVADKEQGNFCEWFRPAARAVGADAGEDQARRALDGLFRKKPAAE